MQKAKPILFSAPMVRAILREIEQPGAGKTQTRRISKKQDWPEKVVRRWPRQTACVPYAPGDMLWVRETCAALEAHDGVDCIRYEADQVWQPIANDAVASCAWVDLHHYGKKRGANVPSIHMPRWASRITLEVTDVRVERLQDIHEADAIAEGLIKLPATGRYVVGKGEQYLERSSLAARTAYAWLWDDINGPGAWDANPWVVAVSFKPHLINVDAFLSAREAA
ncbi:Phage-related protein [Hyphomicrobium sulfonivorans]|uniref:Phage-related protein n=1 Tax=Hyphomicrobium sulfonivorans TaxID=121290 RepID=A0A120CXC3_HYPSL|nr:hypothetical protein [Hyphomicrobium sulfonivorans]KWT70720.1 Phage-related protein [Hyphomicrobium sulfonivorans]